MVVRPTNLETKTQPAEKLKQNAGYYQTMHSQYHKIGMQRKLKSLKTKSKEVTL